MSPWCPSPARSWCRRGTRSPSRPGPAPTAYYRDDAYQQAGATIESDRAALLGVGRLRLQGERADGRRRDRMRRDRVDAAGHLPARLAHAASQPRRRRSPGGAQDHAPSRPTPFRARPARSRWTRSRRWRASPATRACSSRPSRLNKYFPMLTTAAGMVFPAKVFVIGAAVAGLQAIATARRLGANVVRDRRPSRGEGADRERRREIRRHRARAGERRGRRRLREGAVGRGQAPPARDARRPSARGRTS